MIRPPPSSTLFPTTPLSRSREQRHSRRGGEQAARDRDDAEPRQFERHGPRSALDEPAPAHRRGQDQRHAQHQGRDRKSTRLNSSHLVISYAVFCLKNKNTT